MTPDEVRQELQKVIRSHVARMRQIGDRDRQCTEALAIVNTTMVYQIGAQHIAKRGSETLKSVMDQSMTDVVEVMRTGNDEQATSGPASQPSQ